MKATLTTIPSYYFIVIALLLVQAVFTVYQGGLTVGNGGKISQLEKQKRDLQAQTQVLNQQLAQRYSLVNIEGSDLYHQFQPMANVLVTSNTNAVASR